MRTYTFDADKPLYEQLYDAIAKDILTGELTKGERLPSKRTLAAHLGLSVITVENAYSQLMSEGYIVSKPRKGYFVGDVRPVFHTSEQPVFKDQEEPPKQWRVDFSSARTDPVDFPFTVWERVNRQVLFERRDDLLTRPPAKGARALREAISHHLRDYRNLDVSPGQIVIGAGTDYLYGLLIQLLGFDFVYGVESPGYNISEQVYKAHHVKVVKLPLDASGLKVPEEDVNVLHITPSHHFPTGIIMPVGRRQDLLAWAAEKGSRYLIEDDYDSEFRMNLRPVPTLFGSDQAGKVIYINTFTKTLASTIRVSYMVLPKGLLERFEQNLSFYASSVPTFEQYTLAAFIEDGHFEKHLNRMRTVYRRRRDALITAIHESPLNDICVLHEQNAGLHFTMMLDMHRDDRDFTDSLARRGVHLIPMSAYGPSAPHRFFTDCTGIRPETLEEGLAVLYEEAIRDEV